VDETRAHTIDAHHVNPEIKKFYGRYCAKRGIKITKEELKKCIPLCSNCHRDFHFLEKKTGISIERVRIFQYR
jgi:predicted HNH restriction endonuclease